MKVALSKCWSDWVGLASGSITEVMIFIFASEKKAIVGGGHDDVHPYPIFTYE